MTNLFFRDVHLAIIRLCLGIRDPLVGLRDPLELYL